MKEGGEMAGRGGPAAGLGLLAFLERARLAGVVLDAHGVIAYCNPYLAEVLGRPREALIGADWFAGIIVGGDPEDMRRLFRELAHGASSFGHEIEVERGDGERRRLDWTTTVLRGSDGAFAGVACIGEDVTESRRAAEAHRLAQAALDSSETAMAIGDAGARLVYVNPAFLRLWGYAREEHVLGRSVLELWADPGAAAVSVEAIVRDGRWTGELVARRVDGREATLGVHANLFSDPETGTVRMISTFQDLTELRRAEERLIAAQRLARIGYWSVDVATSRVTWGDETFRVFGISRDGFAATQDAFLALVHPGDRAAIEGAFTRMFGGGESVSMDFRVVVPGGAERVIHSEGAALRDAYGHVVELRGVVQDVTERVRLEEQLRQSQKMEAVGALAGGIAHDFNNMLTVILSLGSVALDALAPWEPARADLEEIVATARRAESLTRQILAFARRQFTRPVALDLNATISGAARMIERLIGEHIVVRLELASHLPDVVADPRQLEQVLVNLAVNARDAMPGGGTLEISTRGLAGSGEARERVELAVRDSGAGMDPETRARAFDPFFTTKAPGHGTGLGLAVVHGIVQQCGGAVRIDSAPGRGTAVVIELPLAGPDTPAAVPAAAPRGAGSAAAGRTILVVEDEAAVRGVAVRCLEGAGYRVIAADGGELALRLAAHAPAIDLLLTDVVMPGMGGTELAERLRAARPGLRVLFMSGFSGSLPEALAPTGGSLLTKPFTPAVLLARVAEAIGVSPPAGARPA